MYLCLKSPKQIIHILDGCIVLQRRSHYRVPPTCVAWGQPLCARLLSSMGRSGYSLLHVLRKRDDIRAWPGHLQTRPCLLPAPMSPSLPSLATDKPGHICSGHGHHQMRHSEIELQYPPN
uniref:Uncharacterized protein n=1 Tax=Arundo donax TaxID=35708 RepID=A0A0A9G558_ARUDO